MKEDCDSTFCNSLDERWFYDTQKYAFIKRKDGKIMHEEFNNFPGYCKEKQCVNRVSHFSITKIYCLTHLHKEKKRNYNLYDICKCSGCSDARFEVYAPDFFTNNIQNGHCALCKCILCVCFGYIKEIGNDDNSKFPNYVNNCGSCLLCFSRTRFVPYNVNFHHCQLTKTEQGLKSVFLKTCKLFFGQFFTQWNYSEDEKLNYGFSFFETIEVKHPIFFDQLAKIYTESIVKAVWHCEISLFSFETSTGKKVYFTEKLDDLHFPFLDIMTCCDLLKKHKREIPNDLRLMSN